MANLSKVLQSYLPSSARGASPELALTFELDREKAEKIKSMMDGMGFRTEEEFFNFAIALTHWALQQAEKGCTIAAIKAKDDGDAEHPEIEVSESVDVPVRGVLSTVSA